MRRTASPCLVLGSGVALLLGGCNDIAQPEPAAPSVPAAASVADAPVPPAPLVTVEFGGSTLDLWPFTGTDFQNASDPINLVFVGMADPLALRAALMALDGNRAVSGFPNQPPFNCVWKDAVGTVQTSYSAHGWSGSAVQLECGDYGPVRFHVRLFAAGAWTLANAHFEVLIPGTTDHEVLSWELAQQFVAADLLRSGLLDGSVPFAMTGVINPAPTYRTIDPRIYNGLPAALIGAIGGPPQPAAAPVPIPSDGRATVLNLAGQAMATAGRTEYAFTLQFGQFIPKPFCSNGPLDWVRVDGPIEFRHTVAIAESGDYQMNAHIHGALQVTPVDPRTSPPTATGEAHRAEVLERYSAFIVGATTRAAALRLRTLLPVGDPFGGRQQIVLTIGPGDSTDHRAEVTCGS